MIHKVIRYITAVIMLKSPAVIKNKSLITESKFFIIFNSVGFVEGLLRILPS